MAVPLAVAGLVFGTGDTQLQNITGADASLTSSMVALTNLNQATVYASSVCETNCTQLTQNISVIISPGAVVGPVSFTQSCEITDVRCAISSLVEEGIKKALTQIEEGGYDVKVTDRPLYDLTPNLLKTTEQLDVSLRNNLFQMISSSCLFETNQTMANNYVYVGTGATTGAISFAQSSSITSTDCVIDVIAKANTYQVDKPSTHNNMLVMLLLIIFFVLLAAFVFVIIFLLSGGDTKLAALLKGNQPRPLKPSQYQAAAPRPPAPYYTQNLPLLPLERTIT